MACKHCGRPINRDVTTYWIHTETRLVRCANGETRAEA